jgi:hypothetical protein
MVSLLAIPSIETPPQTFQQLAGSDYGVGFLKAGDSALNALKSSTDPVYMKLVGNMEIISSINGFTCFERVLRGKYACLAYRFSHEFIKASNLSDAESRDLITAPDTTFNVFI